MDVPKNGTTLSCLIIFKTFIPCSKSAFPESSQLKTEKEKLVDLGEIIFVIFAEVIRCQYHPSSQNIISILVTCAQGTNLTGKGHFLNLLPQSLEKS